MTPSDTYNTLVLHHCHQITWTLIWNKYFKSWFSTLRSSVTSATSGTTSDASALDRWVQTLSTSTTAPGASPCVGPPSWSWGPTATGTIAQIPMRELKPRRLGSFKNWVLRICSAYRYLGCVPWCSFVDPRRFRRRTSLDLIVLIHQTLYTHIVKTIT